MNIRIGAMYGYDVGAFVEAFTECDDNAQVAMRLGITRRTVSNRSNHLRLAGVTLPYRLERHNQTEDEETELIDEAIATARGREKKENHNGY